MYYGYILLYDNMISIIFDFKWNLHQIMWRLDLFKDEVNFLFVVARQVQRVRNGACKWLRNVFYK